MMSLGDVLLRWLSELGSGSVKQLEDGVRGFARSHRVDPSREAAWRWIKDVSALGHLDVDRQQGAWSVAPPVITRLPFSDGLALITGSRTSTWHRRLNEAGAEWLQVDEVANQHDVDAMPVPASIVVQYDDPVDLSSTAERLACSFTPCAALQYFGLLPEIGLGPEEAAPVSPTTMERYDHPRGEYLPAQSYSQDGLYRWRAPDWSRTLRLRRQSRWHTVDHEVGVYLELERLGQTVLRWLPEEGVGREKVGRLCASATAPMPAIHARAATLCTGLRPLRDQPNGTVFYDNVPYAAACKVAKTLHQKLTVGNSSSTSLQGAK